MSWLSSKLKKSASRGTGIFSWDNQILGYFGIDEDKPSSFESYWVSKAREEGRNISNPQFKKTKENEKVVPILLLGVIAYMTGMF